MLSALVRAFAQLSDPPVRRVLWISVLAAITGFALLAFCVWFALFETRISTLSWLDTTVDLLGGLAVLVVPYFLFPAVTAVVAGFLLEDVVDAVEHRHYPHLSSPRRRSMAEDVLSAVKFFVVLVGLNLLALPLYLTVISTPLVFYGLNGYLLGREYYELVALRRLTPVAARALRRSNGLKLFAAGVIIAFLSTIPVVNLLVPVIASAFMTHVFHAFAAQLLLPA